MSDAPDGDVTPIRVPQPAHVGARPHGGDHHRDRRHPAGRPPLRRPGLLHRRPRAVIPGLVERIRAGGPIPFATFMDAALYDPAAGFYAAGGRAGGRAGQFLTSPEVGPLFGAVLARALDAWWEEAGRPSPFVVVDAGAGPGTLARAVLAARPACGRRRPPLRRRRAGRGPAGGPRRPGRGVRRDAARRAVHGCRGRQRAARQPALPPGRSTTEAGGRPSSTSTPPGGPWRCSCPFAEVPACLPATAAHGARAPVQEEAARWVRDVLARLRPPGRLVVLDYASSTADMAARPWREWLRTYRDHQRGGHYLADPGTQDITSDVALDQLAAAAPRRRPRPSSCGRTASRSSSTRGGGRGPRTRRRPTSPRCRPAAGCGRPRR